MTHVNRVMYNYCKIKFYCKFVIHVARTKPAYGLCVCFHMHAHLVSATHIICVELKLHNTDLQLIRNSHHIC